MKNCDIICDVDGVLLDFSHSFSAFCKKMYDVTISPDPEEWGYGFKDEERLWEMMTEFSASEDYKSLPLYDKTAPAALNKLLKDSDLDVMVVTAAEPAHRKSRVENLKAMGFKIPDSKLILDLKKKELIINKLKPKLCIDDSPKNIKAFTDAGIIVLAPKKAKYAMGSKPQLFYSTLYSAIESAKAILKKPQ
jgi:hypothetical protein